MWMPDGGCISDDWLNEGFVGEQECFFLVHPSGICKNLYDVEALGRFCSDIFDV